MNKKKNLRFFCPSFFPKTRQGGDRTVSMYWFAILVIVAGGIVYMAAVFYGTPYDIREIEGNLLINKIADCLVKDNYFNDEVSQDNFFVVCNLSFATEKFSKWNNDQYYIEIQPLNIKQGNAELTSFCSADLDKNPFCITRGFYVLTNDSEERFIDIQVAVRKTEKNTK